MNWQSVFNPFSKFAEKQLLAVGLFFLVVNCMICFYTQTQMDSIFHFSDNENLSLVAAFLYVAISTVSAVIFLFLLSLFFNKKTRLVDVVNTVLISQAPNFLILLLTKFSGMNEMAKEMSTSAKVPSFDLNTFDLLKLLLTSFLVLACVIYGMVLLYNGFKTATNIKKWQHNTIFIILLFIFILLHQVYLQGLDL